MVVIHIIINHIEKVYFVLFTMDKIELDNTFNDISIMAILISIE